MSARWWIPRAPALEGAALVRFARQSAYASLVRMRRLLPIVALLHLIHLVVFGAFPSAPTAARWADGLVLLHGAMTVVAPLLAVLATRWEDASVGRMRGLIFGTSVVYLAFGALVMLVDQLIAALPIAYLVTCLAVGMVLHLPGRWSALAYGLSFAVAAGGLQVVQPSAALRASLTVNMVTFTVLGWAIGQMQYIAAVRNFQLGQTIAEQQVRLAAALRTQKAHARRLRAEVDERRRNEDQMQLELMVDHLTGASSRRHLFERSEGVVGGVVMVDIDHFKRINDEHGHDVGDAVLRGLVDRLREAVRPDDLVARLGGEEFAVLLPDATEGRVAVIAERLRRAVAERPFATTRGELTVTISAGWSMLEPGASLDDALQRADVGLYAAKNAGRDRVEHGG